MNMKITNDTGWRVTHVNRKGTIKDLERVIDYSGSVDVHEIERMSENASTVLPPVVIFKPGRVIMYATQDSSD